MNRYCLLISIALMVTIGCAPAPEAPKDAREAAQSQAELSANDDQAKLWQEAAETGTSEGMELLAVDGEAVERRDPVDVPDQAIKAEPKAYDESVQSALAVVAAVELEEPWSGQVRVVSTKGELLTLDLGDDRVVTLQTKVRGAPLRVAEDEAGELFFRVGDPFARNDVLALKVKDDDLLYSLVGGNEPVSFKVEAFGLSATQVGEPEGNTMAVKLSAAGETYTVTAGEQAVFRKIGLTVEVKASIAVQGESAYALPGRPYRIELLGWRTK